MKDSGIPYAQQIPTAWNLIPNRYLFEYHSKKVGSESSKYQLLSLTTQGVKERDITAVGGKVPESYDTYQTVEKGDMIFCLFDLDCSAVFSGLSDYEGMITSAYDVMRPNAKIFDSLYSRYWFSYVFSKRYYMMYSQNLRYTITSSIFNSIKTPCPPIEEQHKIGVFLDRKCSEIDSVVCETEQTIEEYKKLKQSLITEVVTGKKRVAADGLSLSNESRKMKDSGVEWIGEVPEEWNLCPFRHLLKERSEKNNPIKSEERLSLSIELGVTLYSEKTTNLDRFKDDFTQYKLAHEGDLVMNSMNMIVGASGVSKYFGCVSPVYYTYYDELEDHVTTKFCEYIFRCKTMLRVLYSLGKGIYAIERGDDKVNTCRLKVSKEDLKSIMIPCPSENEQRIIVKYLSTKCSEIDNLIADKQTLLQELDTYKKSLIYECVTGKREVN